MTARRGASVVDFAGTRVTVEPHPAGDRISVQVCEPSGAYLRCKATAYLTADQARDIAECLYPAFPPPPVDPVAQAWDSGLAPTPARGPLPVNRTLTAAELDAHGLYPPMGPPPPPQPVAFVQLCAVPWTGGVCELWALDQQGRVWYATRTDDGYWNAWDRHPMPEASP